VTDDWFLVAVLFFTVLLVLLIAVPQAIVLLEDRRDRGGPHELGKRLARTRVVTGGRAR
jgi:hypothetical protein